MRHRRPALTARTAVIGVGVVFALAGRACARAPAADLAAAPTFTRDVAPILYRNCAPCHHPEGPGPFPLLTFDDARRHARQIVKVTTSRYMPPWPPEPGHSRFVGERRLSNADIATLGAWQRAGSPEGDRKDLASPPTFTSGWQLGAPDLVLTPPGSFTLPAEGADTFWNVVLPASWTARVTSAQSRFSRGTGRSCTMRTSSSIAAGWAERSTRRRPAWGSPGWTSKSCRTRSSPTATSCSGSRARRRYRSPPTWPGVWIPPTDLILNMHLQPSGRAEPISPSIGLYFTDTPPTRVPMLLQLEHDGAVDIPAGDGAFSVTDELQLPVDVQLLGLYPHAHYLGRSSKAPHGCPTAPPDR